MNNNQITIPTRVEGKPFYSSRADVALRECQVEHEALFMPQLADARVLDQNKQSLLWNDWYTTTSIRATGTTKQGSPVVVYAHVPNYFSNPENIRAAIEQGLLFYAGRMPLEEFQRLLDLKDDKNVFVIDHDKLKSSTSNVVSTKDALKHPQTIPFLGGEERAEQYIKAHEKIFGNRIGIWHSDDLKDVPLGRLLYVGDGDYGGLDGSSLGSSARFVGVRRGSAEGAQNFSGPSQTSQKSPTIEQILTLAEDYVPKVVHKDFERRLKQFYK